VEGKTTTTRRKNTKPQTHANALHSFAETKLVKFHREKMTVGIYIERRRKLNKAIQIITPENLLHFEQN
jgi:hypothetical protein